MNQREEFRNRRAVVAFSWFDTCLGMEGVWVGAPSNGHFTHPAVLLYNCQGKTEKLFYLQCRHGRLGVGNGTPLQYSCLENLMGGGAWWAAVHGVANSRTRLSDFTFTFHFHALEKEMAAHSSVLAWRIPGTGEPGGLLSMGLHRVGHD